MGTNLPTILPSTFLFPSPQPFIYFLLTTIPSFSPILSNFSFFLSLRRCLPPGSSSWCTTPSSSSTWCTTPSSSSPWCTAPASSSPWCTALAIGSSWCTTPSSSSPWSTTPSSSSRGQPVVYSSFPEDVSVPPTLRAGGRAGGLGGGEERLRKVRSIPWLELLLPSQLHSQPPAARPRGC